MSTYLYAFFVALLIALVFLGVIDLFYRDELEWFKCRLCKWWNRESDD